MAAHADCRFYRARRRLHPARQAARTASSRTPAQTLRPHLLPAPTLCRRRLSVDRRGETAKPARLRAPAPDYTRRHDGRRDDGVADCRTVAQRFYQARLPQTLPHRRLHPLHRRHLARCFNERESDILHHRPRDSDHRRVRALSVDVRTDISGECVYGRSGITQKAV